MKTVIVGGSKILAGIVVVGLLVVLAVLLWLQYGISPFNRLKAQTLAIGRTDPDRAMTMIPKLYELAEKDKVNLQDRSKMYIDIGRFYVDHGFYDLGLEALTKCVECSRASWRGTTEANGLLSRAITELKMTPERPLTEADLKELQVAEQIHPSLEEGTDKGFWPQYYETVGRLQSCLKHYNQAEPNLKKAIDLCLKAGLNEYELAGIEGYYLNCLVEQGKYALANKSFVEFYQALPPATSQALLQSRYFDALSAVRRMRDVHFTARVQKLLKDHKFAELDAEVAELQKDRRMYPSGVPVLCDLYSALENVRSANSESVWVETLDSARQWVKANPKSDAAKIVLGRMLIGYAWKARGSGWSSEVTEAGWKQMAERLDECRTVLEKVQSKEPEWYTAMQRCALGQSWERSEYDALVAAGQKKYPTYDYIVIYKAYWLLPRWNGAEGELEKYVADESDKRSGTAGDILYARTAWYLDYSHPTQVFSNTALKWPRVKAGLQALIKQFPDSYQARGMLSTMAIEAGDEKAALSAFSDGGPKTTYKSTNN